MNIQPCFVPFWVFPPLWSRTSKFSQRIYQKSLERFYRRLPFN